jgi:hypothetical protein
MQRQCPCVACGGKSEPACLRSRQIAVSKRDKLIKEGCGGSEQCVNPIPSLEHAPRVPKQSGIEHIPQVPKQSVDKKDHQINRLLAKIEKLESELFESQNQKIALMVGFGIFAVVIGMSIYLKK